MSSIEIPSFRFADEALELEVTGDDLPEGADRGEGNFDLRAASGKGFASLNLELGLEPDLLELILPGEEISDPPVTAIVVEESSSGRRRLVHEMSGDLPGTLSLDWECDLSNQFGTVSLTPMLIRTEAGADPPFAGHKGAILATGVPLELFIDDRPPRAGNFLDVQWVSFAEEAAKGDSSLCDAEDLIYFLDTTTEDSAVLFLNEDIEDLKATLNAPDARRGRVERIRASTFSTITAHVWGQLAARALIELTQVLDRDEVEPGSGNSVDFLPDWASDVVGELASDFYGNRSLAANVGEFEQGFLSAPAELQLEIDSFAQRMAELDTAFKGLNLWRAGSP